MFSLTRSNLLRQLPDLNQIIRRLLEIVTVSNSIGTYFCQLLYCIYRDIHQKAKRAIQLIRPPEEL